MQKRIIPFGARVYRLVGQGAATLLLGVEMCLFNLIDGGAFVDEGEEGVIRTCATTFHMVQNPSLQI